MTRWCLGRSSYTTTIQYGLPSLIIFRIATFLPDACVYSRLGLISAETNKRSVNLSFPHLKQGVFGENHLFHWGKCSTARSHFSSLRVPPTHSHTSRFASRGCGVFVCAKCYNLLVMTVAETTKIALFKGRGIRKVLHHGEWWFSVVDACGILTDSVDAGAYWRKLK